MFAVPGFCLPKKLGIVGPMDLERFGRIVFNRRTELGLTQEEVARNGGPTDTTMGKIENGEWVPGNRKTTLRKLDVGLQWRDGSAQRTLAGGGPIPIESPAVNWVNFNDEEATEERIKAEGLWHTVSHTWSLVDKVLDELRRSNPSQELVESIRQVVMVLGLYIAGQVMESDAPREDRDRALAELYRRRERADQLLRGGFNDLETEASSGASGEAHQKQEVKPEPPSTIETALGDHWAESVDWSTIRTPADVQRLALELAEEALKMHGQVDLDLNDFAAKIRNYADALRREQDTEQGNEIEEVRVDTAWRVTEEPKSPPPVWDGHYRTMVGLLTTLASIDPALDFLPEFEQLTRAIEPSLDTPMGMRQYIVSTKDILGRARDKLQLYSDDPEQMRTIDEMIARVEEHANAASVAAGAGSVSQLRPAHWNQSPPPPTTAKAASKGYKQSDDERDDTE